MSDTTLTDKVVTRVGPTDPSEDAAARERIVTARIGLLLKSPFFGNLATRLRMINADSWVETAATDGFNLYYNSRFIAELTTKEVEFLIGHEVLHIVYDHLGRRDDRIPMLWNVACDYAVNADLKAHKVGEFISSGLYDPKYQGMTSEDIYDDLKENAEYIDIDSLVDQMIDEHLDGADGSDASDGSGDKDEKGRPKMSGEDREQARREIKQAILNAAQQAGADNIPGNVARMIKEMTDPVMPWRELIQTNLTSAIKSDYSWMRPSRRGWHHDAVMPGMTPGEEIDVVVFIDLSGSISNDQAKAFISEVAGMMDAFDGFRIRIACFDTEVYNMQEFTSENLDDIGDYELVGGGGTDFDCIFTYLKEQGIVPERLIVFTDMYPCGSFGDPDYCDTTWISHGNPNPDPPFGVVAIYDDHAK